MAIINNQGVFIGPPLGEGESTSFTNFRNNDDFSVDSFDETYNLPNFPNNVGIALVRSSESPADYATISLRGIDTSTIYADNVINNVDYAVSGDIYVGYKIGPLGPIPNIKNNSFSKFNNNVCVDGTIICEGGITATSVLCASINACSITSPTTKCFNIPHPLKENKRLVYACLEGPEAGVYVRGRITNSNVIELPDYWSELVDLDSITVTLTQIGYSQDLMVEKIENGKVFIKSGNQNEIDCYYIVNGVRQDLPPLEVEPDA